MRTAIAISLLFLAAGFASAQEPPPMELRTYDISKISARRLSMEGPQLGAEMHYPAFSDEATPDYPGPCIEMDAVADLVRDSIDSEVWDEGGDVQARQGGTLLVYAPASTQLKVANLLGELETAASRRVRMTVNAWSLPAARYFAAADGDAATLDPAKLGGTRMESSSLELYPGVRGSVKVVNRVRYVGDYDVEIAQGSNISDPITCIGREGFVADFIARPTIDGSKILVEALFRQGRFDRPFRIAELGVDEEYFARPFRSEVRRNLGRIELPLFRHTEAFSTHLVASGGAFAVPVLRDDRVILFLVRPQVLGRSMPDWFVDVGCMTSRSMGIAFGYPLKGVESDTLALLAPQVLRRDQDGPQILGGGIEDLMDLVTSLVEPDYWESGEARINISGESRMILRVDKPVLQRVRSFIKGHESRGLKPVRLDVRVYSAGIPFESGAGKSLNGDFTLRHAGSAATLALRTASIMSGKTKNYVADYDVEVAQESRIADPIVAQTFEGFVANLTPTFSVDGSTLRIDVELLLSQWADARSYDSDTQFLGPIDTVTEKRTLYAGAVELPTGSTYVIDAGPDPVTPGRRLAVLIRTAVK